MKHDRDVEGYYEVITTPMDLTKIKKKLEEANRSKYNVRARARDPRDNVIPWVASERAARGCRAVWATRPLLTSRRTLIR